MCNFIDVVKYFQLKFYSTLYNDPYNKYDDIAFDELNVFETFNNKYVPMNWCVDLSGEELDYLVIKFFGSKCYVNQHCFVIGDVRPMLKSYFLGIILACELCYVNCTHG